MITIVLADQQHLRSGVSGYVGTPARGSELVRAIRKVAAGGGHSSANIASRLSISHRTAESHRANVMRKLHLGNQIDLVRFAIA